MQIKFFYPRWGMEHLSYDETFRRAKEAGYDGIDTSVPFEGRAREEIVNASKTYDMQVIGVQHASNGRNGEEYLSEFRQHIDNILSINPLFISSQTGRDFYDFEDNKKVFEYAKQVTEQTGVPIYHETHRNKALFCPKVGAQFIDALPHLQLTTDLSHWCNVSESYLQDQQKSIQKAISRTHYLHARVGHTQGPQVTDPRVPEWQEALQHHLGWWDAIVAARNADGTKLLVILPEFGPVPYMTVDPKTGKPLADQWEVNLYMRDLLKERYKEFVTDKTTATQTATV